jgi:hypothetical protein
LTDAPQSAGLVAFADRIELWLIDRLRPVCDRPGLGRSVHCPERIGPQWVAR